MDISRNNNIYWDTKSTELYEKAYELLLISTMTHNQRLKEQNKDIRVAYCTLSDFVYTIENHDGLHADLIDKARNILRNKKIEKIKRNI